MEKQPTPQPTSELKLDESTKTKVRGAASKLRLDFETSKGADLATFFAGDSNQEAEAHRFLFDASNARQEIEDRNIYNSGSSTA